MKREPKPIYEWKPMNIVERLFWHKCWHCDLEFRYELGGGEIDNGHIPFIMLFIAGLCTLGIFQIVLYKHTRCICRQCFKDHVSQTNRKHAKLWQNKFSRMINYENKDRTELLA